RRDPHLARRPLPLRPVNHQLYHRLGYRTRGVIMAELLADPGFDLIYGGSCVRGSSVLCCAVPTRSGWH
ncbi:MAG: hypothetical protein ABJA81_03950, partial [Nocardioidaceae bacterium]